MSKDTVVQSFENLLNFVDAEHRLDHADGLVEEDKGPKCITCNWLADAHKNYDVLRTNF